MKGHSIQQYASHHETSPGRSSIIRSKGLAKSGISKWPGLVLLLAATSVAQASIATFDDLSLAPESFWNGADLSGGFVSGEAFFSNTYNADWASWDGFAYSNITDTQLQDYAAQYNAIPGSGQGGSTNYGVAFVGWEAPPTITLTTVQTLEGLYVTNNNYAYYSMRDGSMFSKQFGGPTGADPDWFRLTITGKDPNGAVTGTAEVYLADYRFEDNSQDYILDTWTFVNLKSLGEVAALEFALDSSDTGDFGMNTPAYLCLDTVIAALPDPRGAYTAAGIDGYVDSLTGEPVDPQDPNAIINPIFCGWATTVIDYQPANGVDPLWADPNLALGPATGDHFDIVSLGELDANDLDQGLAPGQITLAFTDPGDPNDRGVIPNHPGYDFVVFENGFISQLTTSAGSMEGQMLAELGYVEVSSNGADFARFPSVSLTPERTGPYGTIEIADVCNLAGKHPNAGGFCIGTPFDLDDLLGCPEVEAGLVDVNDIRYVRIVDVPGTGAFFDAATTQVHPGTAPDHVNYTEDHPIYDAWPTWGSGGFDLEAVGILSEPQATDPNLAGEVGAIDPEQGTR